MSPGRWSFIFCACLLASSGSHRAFSLTSSEEFATDLLAWCLSVKKELVEHPAYHVTPARIEEFGDDRIGSVLNFFEINVPLPDQVPRSSRIRSDDDGVIVFRMTYADDVVIVLISEPKVTITNVIEEFRIQLPERVGDHIRKEYGSYEEFTQRNFHSKLTKLDLKLEGLKQSPEDLNCSAGSVEDVLITYSQLLASATPYVPSRRRESPQVFLSNNSLPGVIAAHFNRGSGAPTKVTWFGDFQSEFRSYTIVIELDAIISKEYEYLPRALASPPARP